MFLVPDNSTIIAAKADLYKNLFYIQHIDNLTVDNIIFTSPDDTAINNRGYIELENANKVVIEDTAFNNADTGFKINFENTDKVEEQNNVKYLITNNVSANNVTCFMHICNINKWDGDTLTADIAEGDPNADAQHVCFYLRPRNNNITLNNIVVTNCPGDVFHFNRFDYFNNLGSYPPLGTSGFEDNNIVVKHVVANNIGSLVGFNSETNNISFKDVHVNNQKRSAGGIIHRFEGICNSVSIEDFEFSDIYRLLAIEETDNSIGTITIKNGIVSGEYKGIPSCNGKVKELNLENITFNNIDSTIEGSIGFMFYNSWDSINMYKLVFNLSNNATRNTEVIRFGDSFKGIVHIDDCSIFKENLDDYALNAIAIINSDDRPIDDSSRFYITNLHRYNLDDIYYIENDIYKNYINVDEASYNLFAGVKVYNSGDCSFKFDEDLNTLTVTSLVEGGWLCALYDMYLDIGNYQVNFNVDNKELFPDYAYQDEETGIDLKDGSIIYIETEDAGNYKFRFFATSDTITNANNTVVYSNIVIKKIF